MLLVMDTAGIFQTTDGAESQLWRLSWDRIDTFLPNLRNDLFKKGKCMEAEYGHNWYSLSHVNNSNINLNIYYTPARRE